MTTDMMETEETTAVETTAPDRVRSKVAAEQMTMHVRNLLTRRDQIAAPFVTKLDALGKKAKTITEKVKAARSEYEDATAELDAEITAALDKLEPWLLKNMHTLPDVKQKRYLTDGPWGAGTGLKVYPARAEMTTEAVELLGDVQGIDDLGQALAKLRPLFPALCDACDEVDEDTARDLVERLCACVQVDVRPSLTQAKKFHDVEPGICGDAISLATYASLVVDGVELRRDVRLPDTTPTTD